MLQVQVRTILQKRILQLEELALGGDSVELASTLNQLAVLNYMQNQHQLVEPIPSPIINSEHSIASIFLALLSSHRNHELMVGAKS